MTAAIRTMKLKHALSQVNAQNVDFHRRPPRQTIDESLSFIAGWRRVHLGKKVRFGRCATRAYGMRSARKSRPDDRR
ncbi:hypothetical protein [Variovorax sp. YR216]|uniref:hypothetical protein n=1 Tax=Variovorax sp. YR216 TaxID=1882828 RepID=UPI0015A4A2B7|nr:hypothetical protein [Variovorax sp. YR216]